MISLIKWIKYQKYIVSLHRLKYKYYAKQKHI